MCPSVSAASIVTREASSGSATMDGTGLTADVADFADSAGIMCPSVSCTAGMPDTEDWLRGEG